jgi:hypothetical protein
VPFRKFAVVWAAAGLISKSRSHVWPDPVPTTSVVLEASTRYQPALDAVKRVVWLIAAAAPITSNRAIGPHSAEFGEIFQVP